MTWSLRCVEKDGRLVELFFDTYHEAYWFKYTNAMSSFEIVPTGWHTELVA